MMAGEEDAARAGGVSDIQSLLATFGAETFAYYAFAPPQYPGLVNTPVAPLQPVEPQPVDPPPQATEAPTIAAPPPPIPVQPPKLPENIAPVSAHVEITPPMDIEDEPYATSYVSLEATDALRAIAAAALASADPRPPELAQPAAMSVAPPAAVEPIAPPPEILPKRPPRPQPNPAVEPATAAMVRSKPEPKLKAKFQPKPSAEPTPEPAPVPAAKARPEPAAKSVEPAPMPAAAEKPDLTVSDGALTAEATSGDGHKVTENSPQSATMSELFSSAESRKPQPRDPPPLAKQAAPAATVPASEVSPPIEKPAKPASQPESETPVQGTLEDLFRRL